MKDKLFTLAGALGGVMFAYGLCWLVCLIGAAMGVKQ